MKYYLISFHHIEDPFSLQNSCHCYVFTSRLNNVSARLFTSRQLGRQKMKIRLQNNIYRIRKIISKMLQITRLSIAKFAYNNNVYNFNLESTSQYFYSVDYYETKESHFYLTYSQQSSISYNLHSFLDVSKYSPKACAKQLINL